MTFQPKGLGLDVFNTRYTLFKNESWEQAGSRVANAAAMAETNGAINLYKSRFEQIIWDNEFMPGGRIWYGAGRPRGQLLNCYVLGVEDSRESWGKTCSDSIVVSGTGGGIGINCSKIRPRGATISGTGGVATGAVSYMEMINAVGNTIKAGGGRRTALMLCLDIGHPDLPEFLDKKLDKSQLNNANISVTFKENPEIFFDKVKNGENYQLTFGNKVYAEVSAREIWHKIVANSIATGDPGLLNQFYANKMSNIWYLHELTSTNPCGEIFMSPNDCCCLGAIVLPRFVQSDGKINYSHLFEVVQLGVRFLDNVLTVNNYPLQAIADTCNFLRRIGLGVMGLHDMLLRMGHRYNSPEGLEVVDKVMKFIKNAAYMASVQLAVEKGSFPGFDADKFLKSNFVKTLKPTIRHDIAKNGIRNCAILTLAPTGTTSMVSDVSSGIEPLFAAAYDRRWLNNGTPEVETKVHPLFEEFVLAGKDVSHFQGSHELPLRDHFEMQRVCQKHIDNAVSKTINVNKDVSAAELADLYMEYLPELKGITIYVDGSKEDQPLTPISIEAALAAVGNSMVGAPMANCKSGVCDT